MPTAQTNLTNTFRSIPHSTTWMEWTPEHVRMLFIDFSSAFNTIIPSRLVSKLNTLGDSHSLFKWITDFLTSTPQSVRMGDHTSHSTGQCPVTCALQTVHLQLHHQTQLQWKALVQKEILNNFGGNIRINFQQLTKLFVLVRACNNYSRGLCNHSNILLSWQHYYLAR